jgi:excisionase family DNA binding protein
MPSADPLKDLLELVRSAARDGVVEALQTQTSVAPKLLTPPPLLDKRALAHALGVSTAKIDRLVRSGEIQYVLVGEVRRFDLDAVRVALEARRQERDRARGSTPELARVPGLPSDVRLLSRARRA